MPEGVGNGLVPVSPGVRHKETAGVILFMVFTELWHRSNPGAFILKAYFCPGSAFSYFVISSSTISSFISEVELVFLAKRL